METLTVGLKVSSPKKFFGGLWGLKKRKKFKYMKKNLIKIIIHAWISSQNLFLVLRYKFQTTYVLTHCLGSISPHGAFWPRLRAGLMTRWLGRLASVEEAMVPDKFTSSAAFCTISSYKITKSSLGNSTQCSTFLLFVIYVAVHVCFINFFSYLWNQNF